MAEPAMTAGLPEGVVSRRTLARDPRRAYYVYLPARRRTPAPTFVSVHGISRNAEEHARAFAPWAERFGVVLVAPLFSPEHAAKYQRLARAPDGVRPDLTLHRILAEVSAAANADVERVFLFGYSGGGQFVHRYAMLHPARVARYVVAAAGWYTFPDADLPYPRGLRATARWPHLELCADAFLEVPAAVLVGERDTRQDVALNKSPRITAQQGQHRMERGERWIAAMRAAARTRGLETPYRFQIMPRCGHSFARGMRRGGMGARTFAFLFERRAADWRARREPPWNSSSMLRSVPEAP